MPIAFRFSLFFTVYFALASKATPATSPSMPDTTNLLKATKLIHQHKALIQTLHAYFHTNDSSSTPRPFLRYDRIKYDSDLDAKRFHTLFELTSTPVVIEGVSNHSYWSSTPTVQWDAHWFKEQCGDAPARIRVGTSSIPLLEWKMYTVKLSLYIDFIQGVTPSLHLNKEFKVDQPNQTYLFDWPLSQCPANVLDQFILPRWFANDLLTL